MKGERFEEKTLIAVPYYGTLSLPPSGLTRIFFLVKVDLIRKAIADLTLQVWNPKKEPNLFRWLRQLRTDGVICGDAPSKYELGLQAEGMWVRWSEEGEVHEVVERWLRSRFHPAELGDTGDDGRSCRIEPIWEMG